MKKMFFPAVLAALSVSVFTARSATAANGSLTPHFKQSSYVNESVTLENKYVTMNFFKRIKGWGWGEILTPEGKLMAVMDHLGELMIRDQDIPDAFRGRFGVPGQDGRRRKSRIQRQIGGRARDVERHFVRQLDALSVRRAGHYRNGDDYRHSGFSFRQTEIRSDGDR